MKLNRSLILAIISIILILGGCTNRIKNQEESISINLFNMEKANNTASQYLNSIIKGDIDNANTFLTEDLLRNNKNLNEGISEIISFKPDSAIEGGNYGYFIYNIIRSSGAEPKSDLEDITFKVKKENGEYKIDEVKSKPKKEVYIDGNALRIIGEEGGKSNLVVNINNLPKDTYIRDNKVMLYKDKVPNEYFGKICLSFKGNRIAITTTNNVDSYICIAYIDDTLMASLIVSNDGGNPETNVGPSGADIIKDALEKPIAKKIVPVDLLKNSKVTKINFSEKEETMEIDYKNEYNIDRIRLYKSDEGTLIQTEMDTMFPANEFNIYDGAFQEDNFKFKVSNSTSGQEEYILNLKTLDINKL